MEEPRRLGGRYELGSVLGRGGMAEVYLAHDTRLGRTVAVKTLRADLARDPSFQARFRREAQSAASLNHPAIVAVYDTGEDYVDGVSIPYIVMEYVDGSTLRELLHSGRKLLPERTLEMTIGILQALEYSHRNNIVHRDIKPANVMLTRTGQVKVMDFGIARAMGDAGMTMTQTSAVIGTAQYLSPEQAKGEQVDARSDLYSTGCLLYELLTVRPPFIGDSPVAVAYQHVREEPQPPSNFDHEITPEMDAIVLKALVKDPDYRYQSADEMRADIEACLDGRRQRKSSTSTVLLVVAGVLVLIGAVLIARAVFGDKPEAGDVPVPVLVGKTPAEAQRLADNAEVTLTQSGAERCDQPKGRICSQIPADGTVSKGDTVTYVLSEGAPKVEVPDVTEKSLDSAREQLTRKGFKVEVDEVESTSEDPGTVIEQRPRGASMAEKNTTVTLTVAKQALKTVPFVEGNPYPSAQQQLQVNGFQVNVEYVDSDKPRDQVLTQKPAGNSQAPENSTVTLTVSKGPEQVITVPPLTGKTLGEAKLLLSQAGLELGDVTGPDDDNARVIDQNPKGGGQPGEEKKVDVTTLDLGGGDNNGNNSDNGNQGNNGNNGDPGNGEEDSDGGWNPFAGLR